jgi:hypothetical protein
MNILTATCSACRSLSAHVTHVFPRDSVSWSASDPRHILASTYRWPAFPFSSRSSCMAHSAPTTSNQTFSTRSASWRINSWTNVSFLTWSFRSFSSDITSRTVIPHSSWSVCPSLTSEQRLPVWRAERVERHSDLRGKAVVRYRHFLSGSTLGAERICSTAPNTALTRLTDCSRVATTAAGHLGATPLSEASVIAEASCRTVAVVWSASSQTMLLGRWAIQPGQTVSLPVRVAPPGGWSARRLMNKRSDTNDYR